MKFTLGLFAILAIIGLGQAHQFPDFGKGPLHEDLQDILDLVPIEKIIDVVVDYMINDKELQEFMKKLEETTVIKDLMVDFQAIPEVINLLNYLHKEGIDVYDMINTINKSLNIKELIPPSLQVSPPKRTGGLRGFFKDIKKHIDFDAYVSIYVDKLQISDAFVNFIDQLKSDNFQQIVNKLSKSKAFQLIVSLLEDKSVNLKIVEDQLYLFLGITVPGPSLKSLIKELEDFINLIDLEKYLNIIIQYINEDEKVQKALLYTFTTEFHDLLRKVEATKEHQALVAYLEKAGIPVVKAIQELHHAIGMEKYVPPNVKSYFMSLIKTQKIGDGMKGLIIDLYNVLPLKEIDALHAKKMRTSKVFVKFIRTLSSEELRKLVIDLRATKAYKEFITKTLEKGLEIEAAAILNGLIIGIKPFVKTIQELHYAIGMEKYVPPNVKSYFRSLIKSQKIGDGMKGLITDLYNVLPLDEIDALHAKKMRTSKVFVKFIRTLSSEELWKLVRDLIETKAYQKFITKTLEKGLEFEAVYDSYPQLSKSIYSSNTMKFTLGLFAILAIIGLGQAHQFPDFGKGPLHEDLQDILDLVPAEKIFEVLVDYMINDEEVLEFMKEFIEETTVIKDLVVDFLAIPEVINLLNYLHKEGIDVYDMINTINKALNIKELIPPSLKVSPPKRTGGLRGFFKDIKKHIDYDVYISIYVDKLQISDAFVNFIDQLKSDNFQQIVNKLSNSKAFQLIVSHLENKSVNLKIVEDYLYLFLGITVPGPSPKSLIKELEDFINLIDLEKYLNIIIQYINEDEKVQKALLYTFTTEFHDLLRAVEATKEHQALVAYLEKAGFPVVKAIQELHHAIGMEKYVPPNVKSYFMSLIKTQKIGDGMKGLIVDLYNVLPLKEINALHAKKMRTSKVFVKFIRTLSSEELRKLVTDLRATKAYKEFITKTLEKGLELEAAAILNGLIIGIKPSMKFILGLFAILAVIGLGQAHQFPDFGKGPLHEDLQDILDLVPIEKIIDVVVDYIINDKELQEFMKELEETTVIKDLMVDFQAIPEVINLLNYLHKEGIDVYDMINTINKSLNIKELIPPNLQVSPPKRTGGIRGFFKDIKKHIDYDAYISIYVDKLQISDAFVNFIDQLKSDNFQQIVNKLSEIKAFQFIISRLENKSVNLKIVKDYLYLFLGITVPGPSPKSLIKELEDFIKLIDMEKYLNIINQYINEDEKVRKALLYTFTTEFHNLLRAVEATEEYQALVAYLEKAGIPVVKAIQELHYAIGMEKYVPPNVKSYFMSLIKTQKIGDGMQGLLRDLYNVLPLDEIDALHAKKMRTSKVFVKFIRTLSSEELRKLVIDLRVTKAYKKFIKKTLKRGLNFESAAILNGRIFGIKPSY
ncbi:uncharacterized protein [Temnothorax longispinosus]|uniref:uncharacterized protein n=1 Tax=Temnothorax longispinosus TaxID=300112 RepID=UPI003A99029D